MSEDWKWLSDIEESLLPLRMPGDPQWVEDSDVIIDHDDFLHLISVVKEMRRGLYHISSEGSWIQGECFTDEEKYKGKSCMEIADETLERCKDGKLE